MLTCREIEGLLDLYIDQELDPLARERCTQHLRRCSQCRALLQSREQEAEVTRGGFPVPELTSGVQLKGLWPNYPQAPQAANKNHEHGLPIS
jgi:anti-sigma factor RsiW